MKLFKGLVFALLICVSLSIFSLAEEFVWTMKPEKMEYMIRMTEDVYLENFGLYVKENGLYKLIDKNGKEIMPFNYSAEYRPLSKDYLIVTRNYKTGVIDKTGKEIIPLKYDLLNRFNDTLLVAWICKDSEAYFLEYECGVIDVNGKEVIKFNYDELSVLNEELLSAKKDGKYGVINKSGKTVVSFKYDAHFELINGCLVSTPLYDKTPSVILDLKGRVLLSDKKIKYVYPAFDGNFRVVYRNDESMYFDGETKILNKSFKVVDTKGLEITPLNDNAYIAVNSDGKSGIVDKSFNTVADFIYDGLTKIDENVIYTYKDGKPLYINAKGEALPAFSEYEGISSLCDGYYRVSKKLGNESAYGIANIEGKLLVEANFRNIKHLGEGVFIFETRSGRMGIGAIGEGDKVNDYVDGLVLRIDKNEALVFGKDAITDVVPVIRNGSTMLPARFVAENLGATVGWNQEKMQVTITPADPGAGQIILTIGSKEAKFGRYGATETLNMAPFVEQGRTYTPVRFIAEKLDYRVFWDQATKTVYIIK